MKANYRGFELEAHRESIRSIWHFITKKGE